MHSCPYSSFLGRKAMIGLLLLLFTCCTVQGFAPCALPQRTAKQVTPLFSQSTSSVSSSSSSPAALWHRERRKQMLERYGDEITPLLNSSSQRVALPLLLFANLTLLSLSIVSGSLPLPLVILLSIFPGSMCSLWQLQILHDVLHGSFTQNKSLSEKLLFWGSMPSVFGYYLYLKFGHLSHHKNVGDTKKASLEKLFDSSSQDFEDGDVLFVAHRMKLKGGIGPKFHVFGKEVKMSLAKSGFNQWKEGKAIRNGLVFTSSFLLERFMLVVNDAIVALVGRNYFFPNKPAEFHKACTKYARVATLVRGLLWATVGWKSLLFLFLSETLWSVPPHPACAMFVTNHGSSEGENGCVPTSSTYAGKWYSLFTLGTNYHCEHHDFPTIPLHKLWRLRQIAPEYYSSGNKDNLFSIMRQTFAHPQFYACMDAGTLQRTTR